jgi:chromobox protein 1
MNEYFDEIGGRPEPKGGQKRKGRPSGVAKSDSGTPALSAKRVKQEKAWSPPPGSWEHDVSHIDTVEENLDPKTGHPGRFAYLVWNNGKKTQHPLKHIYQKCPQKVRQGILHADQTVELTCARCSSTTRAT